MKQTNKKKQKNGSKVYMDTKIYENVGDSVFYKKMKQSKEIRGLLISSIRVKSMSSLARVSSTLEPAPKLHVSFCLKPTELRTLPELSALTLSFLVEGKP